MKAESVDSLFGFPTSNNLIKTISSDNSYKGEILEVLEICLPFVVTKNHSVYSSHGLLTLDTRQAILMELSKEFVKVALSMS